MLQIIDALIMKHRDDSAGPPAGTRTP